MRTELDLFIQKIAHLQDSADRRYFPEGIFESYRSNRFWRYHRPDTNVFFTAITVFTLNNIIEKLSTESQKLVNECYADITTVDQPLGPWMRHNQVNTANGGGR